MLKGKKFSVIKYLFVVVLVCLGGYTVGAMFSITNFFRSTPAKPLVKKVTIWVHGTRGAAFLPVGITKEIRTIEQNVCTVPLGLHKAVTIDKRYYQHSIAYTLSQAAPDEFPLDDFYIFGWSGKLNLQHREQEGKRFYKDLCDVVATYKSKNIVPEITIITHSHGGNVTLNLVKEHINDSKPTFIIDRLILLACPVQEPTSSLVKHNFFKKTYVLFSPIDQIQVLDPQKLHVLSTRINEAFKAGSWQKFFDAWKSVGTTPLFSARTFPSHGTIKQVAVSWREKAPWAAQDFAPFGSYAPWVKKWVEQFDQRQKRGLAHIEFMLPLFLNKLPEIVHQADQVAIQQEPMSINI